MDIKTLESLGINVETLGDRIVDQAVDVLLNTCGFDPETEEETRYDSKFKREIAARIQKAVDAKISAIAEEHVLPKISEMIEKVNLQKTNQYGEPKGDPLTFVEYIASRAEAYMSENVDFHGKSKEESGGYDWRSCGPRLTVLMRNYIRTTLEEHAKRAVSDVNAVVAKNIEKAAKEAIAAAAANLKVSVSA